MKADEFPPFFLQQLAKDMKIFPHMMQGITNILHDSQNFHIIKTTKNVEICFGMIFLFFMEKGAFM